jgi:hypothetical protein
MKAGAGTPDQIAHSVMIEVYLNFLSRVAYAHLGAEIEMGGSLGKPDTRRT